MARKEPKEKSDTHLTILQNLSAQLSKPAFRKSFFNDPYWALERAGINVDRIPEGIVDVLAQLSLEELNIIARLNSQRAIIDKAASGLEGGFLF